MKNPTTPQPAQRRIRTTPQVVSGRGTKPVGVAKTFSNSRNYRNYRRYVKDELL